MGRNKADFHGVKLSHYLEDGYVEINAHLDGEEIGHLVLEPSGRVGDIAVEDEHQSKGIATAMWRHAQNLHKQGVIKKEPKHSSGTTVEGYHWAMSTGDPVPPREMGMYGYGEEDQDWSGRK